MNHLDAETKGDWSPTVTGYKLISQDIIQLKDSICLDLHTDKRIITYTYYIERNYKKGLFTQKYYGTGSWKVSLNSNYGSGIEVNLADGKNNSVSILQDDFIVEPNSFGKLIIEFIFY